MEQKLIMLYPLKRIKFSKKIIFILLLFIGCVNNEEEQFIANDYREMIHSYDYYYGFNLKTPDKTMENLNAYIESNFNDLEYVKKNEYKIQLSKKDSIIFLISSGIYKRVKIPLKMNLNNNRFNYCETSIAMEGFFSKNFRPLNRSYLPQINEYLLNSFQDSIIIPIYNKKRITDNGSKAIFKYQNDSISIVCSTNFSNDKKLKKIQDSLISYIKRENMEFDYALIPVEKNNLK